MVTFRVDASTEAFGLDTGRAAMEERGSLALSAEGLEL